MPVAGYGVAVLVNRVRRPKADEAPVAAVTETPGVSHEPPRFG
jgi:hypothetical protein